jgi:hypothetical protein
LVPTILMTLMTLMTLMIPMVLIGSHSSLCSAYYPPSSRQLVVSPFPSLVLRDDMNIDIDESDCIMVQEGGSDVGKRSVGVAGAKDPAEAGAGAPVVCLNAPPVKRHLFV